VPELARFHLAFPVRDLETARSFYGGVLGCAEGRSSDRWVDFDFRGHQVTAHLVRADDSLEATSAVDGDAVPVRHFGLILARSEWEELADRLRDAGADFLIDPRVRFRGQVGEQATMFVRDPDGNALEFKSFADDQRVFAR